MCVISGCPWASPCLKTLHMQVCHTQHTEPAPSPCTAAMSASSILQLQVATLPLNILIPVLQGLQDVIGVFIVHGIM